MKKLLMVLAVLCIPQVVMADQVKRTHAVKILEQGKILNEVKLTIHGEEYGNFNKVYTVLFKGEPYQCNVIKSSLIAIMPSCVKLRTQ